jgi:hypothetical protein
MNSQTSLLLVIMIKEGNQKLLVGTDKILSGSLKRSVRYCRPAAEIYIHGYDDISPGEITQC